MAEYFIIEKNSAGRAHLLFDGNDIVVGQKYLLSEQDKFSIENLTDFKAEPMDSFTFSIEIDGIKSQNQSIAQINYYPIAGIPLEVDESHNMNLNEEFEVSDAIPYEDNFDRIIIQEITGKGAWKIENSTLVIGGVYFYYEIFEKLKFISDDPGAENNYASLKFQHATKEIVFENENIITINTTSLAELTTDNEILSSVDDELKIREFSFTLSNQVVNKTFQIAINISVANFAENIKDKIDFEYDNIISSYTLAGIQNIDYLNSEPDGIMFFSVRLQMVGDFEPGDMIEIELESIDDDVDLVNPIKKNITFNL